MSSGRIEFLNDELLAFKLFQEEKEKLELSKQSNKLKPLLEASDQAYAQWISAQYSGATQEQLIRLEESYNFAKTKYETEKKKTSVGGSSAVIRGSLEEKKPIIVSAAVKPLYVFSEKEMEQINEHYEKLDEKLRRLMDAAMNESVSLELIADPVFIRGEGHVFKRETLNAMLLKTGTAIAPHNQEIKFQKSDIIPCNTLIEAMQLLLGVIQNKMKPVQNVQDKLLTLGSGQERTRVKPDVVAMIEKYYEVSLIPRHKLLFDAICRDPKTKKIMDDPVFLPDGYIYDRSTALAYLELADGRCPKNPEITFTKRDITTCYFVISVLEHLKEDILEQVKKMKAAAEENKNNSGVQQRRVGI